ncbi:MAG: bL21 family ribosomal protein [Candidatus Hodgkinia cicadicola]
MIVEMEGKQYIVGNFDMFEIISTKCYLSNVVIGKVLFYKTNDECIYAGGATYDAFVGHVTSLWKWKKVKVCKFRRRKNSMRIKVKILFKTIIKIDKIIKLKAGSGSRTRTCDL